MIGLKSRQQHLDEMGIPQWYARFRLPGAAKSPKMPSQELVETANIASTLRPIEKPLDNTLKSEVAMLENINSPADLPVIDEPKNEPELELELEKEPEISFVDRVEIPTSSTRQETTLRLYQAGAILVTTNSKQDTPRASELMLLQNILIMLGVEKSKCVYSKSFTWPIFHSQKIPVNQQNSQHELTDRWLSSALEGSVSAFLHFGTQSRGIIESLVDNRAPVFLTFEHSLDELLAIPTRKSAIWQKLLQNLDRFKLK